MQLTSIAVAIATSTFACSLVVYTTKHSMAGNHSSHRLTFWRVPLVPSSTPMHAGRLLTLQGWVYNQPLLDKWQFIAQIDLFGDFRVLNRVKLLVST